MSYIVKALGTATFPKRVGEHPQADNWVAGMIDEVDTALYQYYAEHTDVFTILSQSGASPSGLAAVSGLTAVDNNNGVLHQVVFTLADVAQAVVNGTEYQGTKLFTFPEGRVNVLGVTASLAQKTTSALAGTLNASSTGAVALGTVTASNVSLTSTMVDLLPSTAFTSSATINVAGTAATAALASAAQFDGTGTAKDMYLNSAFATTTDVDGNATMTWTGTITLTYLFLGDY
jgi:hypothetical protein